MKQEIVDAYLEVREMNAPDVVIADRELNRRFLEACRRHGVTDDDAEVNRSLLNARKNGYFKGIRSKRVTVPNQENFRFASEIAVRFLGRRDSITLDQILCDPTKALEFDAIAARISSGFSSFQYRWAALGLRKRRQLKPELIATVIEQVETVRHSVDELDIELIPNQQGLYMFHDSKCTLYIGEAISLHKRVKKHLDHSDSKGLAQWLWQFGKGDLHLEIHVLPKTTLTRVRKALEAEMIKSRKPLFNLAGID